MDKKIVGICMAMCPEDEIKIRQKERLLHKLEVLTSSLNSRTPIADPKRMVKCYCRSAADVNVADPHLLRPFNVLYYTLQYLLFDASQKPIASTISRYNYITDRLKAVRLDITVQQLNPEECILLLEPIIRFHIFYGYLLCEVEINYYDPVLNKKNLTDCLKQLLVSYDIFYNTKNSVTLQPNSLLKQSKNYNCFNLDRHLMECLYILSNLNQFEPVQRYLILSKDFRNHKSVKLAYEIAISYINGNYVRLCRLARNLCPLSYCAFALHLPYIQRKALKIMSVVYNGKVSVVPVCILKEMLLFESEHQVMDVCKYYGLNVDDGGVLFSKTCFRSDIKMMGPVKSHSILDIENLTVEKIYA